MEQLTIVSLKMGLPLSDIDSGKQGRRAIR